MYVVKTKGKDLKKRESYVTAWQKKRYVLIVWE
jgi:hypothetical protein